MPLRVVAKLWPQGAAGARAPSAANPEAAAMAHAPAAGGAPARVALQEARPAQGSAKFWRRWSGGAHRAAAPTAPAQRAAAPRRPNLAEALACIAAAARGDAAGAPALAQLEAALESCDACVWSARSMLWDQLAIPLRGAPSSPVLQDALEAWLLRNAAGRAQSLAHELGKPTALRTALARRLLAPPFAAASAPWRDALAAIAAARDEAARQPAAPKWQDEVVFWPMAKRPSSPGLAGKGPSYLHDLAAGRTFRVSPHVLAGGFFKVRAALDEEGNAWVMRVGRLFATASTKPSTEPRDPRGRGVLTDDAMADELHAMLLAHSPLRPVRLFLHTSGRIYGLMPKMAADLAQVQLVVADHPDVQPYFAALLRQAVDASLGALARLHGRGYGHYDLSPENLFLRPEGDALLGDYGLALPFAEVCGTRGRHGLMAPEMVDGPFGGSRGAADVWSLGMSVWALLAPEQLERTALMRAETAAERAAAYASFAAWAPVHLVPALRAPSLSPRSLADDDAGRWERAARVAAARDPELALAVLPSALRVAYAQRLTAARLRSKVARRLRPGGGERADGTGGDGAGAAAPAPGAPLVPLLEACPDNGLARAFAQLHRLPPRPPTPGDAQEAAVWRAADDRYEYADVQDGSALCVALSHAARALLSTPLAVGRALAADPLAEADWLLAALEADGVPLPGAELQMRVRTRHLAEALHCACGPGAEKALGAVRRHLAALDESLLLRRQLG